MSFFSKLKQFVGAGTVKVALTVPPEVQKAGAQLSGSVALNAVSDQHVETFASLAARWLTERDYEDPAEYVAVLQTLAPEGVRVLHLITGGPIDFGCVFTAEGATFQLSLTLETGTVGARRVAT